MERGFEIYNLNYERKARQFDSAGVDPGSIFSNESVGQWYLAVVLKNPADARGRKYKVWGEHYDHIFAGKQPIEVYIAASLLGRLVTRWITKSRLKTSPDDVKRMLAKRGAFHVARIASFLWKGDDKWNEPREQLAQRVEELRSDDALDWHIEQAFDFLERIIRDDGGFAEDIDRTLKSYVLNEIIDKALYTS